jgi:hypothetical protein
MGRASPKVSIVKNKSITFAALKKAGFILSGCWMLGERKTPELHNILGSIPRKSAIYLFVVKDQVSYVGKASSIVSRLGQYERAFRYKRGNLKVDKGIRDVLTNGGTVSVYTLIITTRIILRGGLPIDYLDGLEAGLIKTLEPPPAWNKERRRHPVHPN